MSSANTNSVLLSPHLAASPTWAPPKSPLPPHRLAKLANALGVSTPIPAMPPSPFVNGSPMSAFHTPSAYLDLRRSPTPSAASPYMNQFSSRYLLHVIPPLDLPHDSSDSAFSDLTPAPASASGYHSHFRRGVLVPVHSTLQSQLWAIAREYALPSTAGIVLYLITATPAPAPENLLTPGSSDAEEIGPRLSEDIWKFIWMKVLRSEETPVSRSPTPHLFGLGVMNANSSFTAGGLQFRSFSQPARSVTPHQTSAVASTSPSTPSSASDQHSRETETPDTSSSSQFGHDPNPPDNDLSSVHLDLPGLNSNSLIPILAKVEFEIDKRKAEWYEPWIRSRRMNHTKRTESRMGTLVNGSGLREDSTDDGNESVTGKKRAPLELKLVESVQNANSTPNFLLSLAITKEVADVQQELGIIAPEGLSASPEPMNARETLEIENDDDNEGSVYSSDDEEPDATDPTGTEGYQQLEDSQWEVERVDEELNEDDTETDADKTEQIPIQSSAPDPLADVFGTDEETWAFEHENTKRESQPHKNLNIVDLALSAADLSAFSGEMSFDSQSTSLGAKGVMEVEELLDRMASKPSLSVTIPQRQSQSLEGGKKHVPPPLVLVPNLYSSAPPPPESTARDLESLSAALSQASPIHSASLAYLDGTPGERELSPRDQSWLALGSEENEFDEYMRPSSPSDMKRGGAFYAGLDLGLDDTLDENDPNDRRHSQFLLAAQLDELERNLVQFSPRALTMTLDGDSPSLVLQSASVMATSPFQPISYHGPMNVKSASFLQTPNPLTAASPLDPSWPSVPITQVSAGQTPQRRSDGPPLPPKISLNGISATAPKQFSATRPQTPSDAPTESELRKIKDQEEPSSAISLSPDPFGRYAPSFTSSGSSQPSPSHWDNGDLPLLSSSSQSQPRPQTRKSETPSSRFSADSATGDDVGSKGGKGNPNIIAVKSIKKLWRKSNNKNSVSETSQAGSQGRASPQLLPPRSSKELAPNIRPIAPSPTPLSLPPSVPPLPFSSSTASAPESKLVDSMLVGIHFDQESPYPVRRPSGTSRNITPPSMPSTPLEPIQEKQGQGTVRKSILKAFKSGSSKNSSGSISSEPRSSVDRKRPSLLAFGSGRASVTSPDIPPPSPQVPEHFDDGGARSVEQRQLRLQPRNMVASPPSASTDPSHHSPRIRQATLNGSSRPHSSSKSTSSRESEETRPSFDVSQFEMVSPKLSLSYPYHGLDQE